MQDFRELSTPDRVKTHRCFEYVAARHDQWRLVLIGTHQDPTRPGAKPETDTKPLLPEMRRYVRWRWPRVPVRTEVLKGFPHESGEVAATLPPLISAVWHEEVDDPARPLPVAYVVVSSATPVIKSQCARTVRDLVPAALPVISLKAQERSAPLVATVEDAPATIDPARLAALVVRAVDLDAAAVLQRIVERHQATDPTCAAVVHVARAVVELRREGALSEKTAGLVADALGTAPGPDLDRADAQLRAWLHSVVADGSQAPE